MEDDRLRSELLKIIHEQENDSNAKIPEFGLFLPIIRSGVIQLVHDAIMSKNVEFYYDQTTEWNKLPIVVYFVEKMVEGCPRLQDSQEVVLKNAGKLFKVIFEKANGVDTK